MSIVINCRTLIAVIIIDCHHLVQKYSQKNALVVFEFREGVSADLGLISVNFWAFKMVADSFWEGLARES